MDSAGLEYNAVGYCFTNNNKPSSSIKSGEFLKQLKVSTLLRKDSMEFSLSTEQFLREIK
jgi:hypothetical protein